MSIDYTTGKDGKGCTRELFLKKEFTDPKEKVIGMALVCYELLRLAAEGSFKKVRMGSYDNAEEHDSFIADVEARLYDFLLACLESENKDKESKKTLDRALDTPESLCVAWSKWSKNKQVDSKVSEAFDSPDHVLKPWKNVSDPRLAYYRKNLIDMLNKRDRIVTSFKHKSYTEHYFSYGPQDLPRMPVDMFEERKEAFASGFVPTLTDADFRRGEELVYHKDGTEGRGKGPGDDDLDQFCREFWNKAADVFDQEYLISVGMVMELLPKLFTFFGIPSRVFLDEEPEEDQDGEKKRKPELESKTPVFDIVKDILEELESRRDEILALARTISPRERKLMLLKKYGLTDLEKARRLGLSSSSRIQEQTANAFRIFKKAGLLSLQPSQKESIYYLEGLVDIAESVWLDEKKELEAFGSLEKSI